jgi:hypothetical protein
MSQPNPPSRLRVVCECVCECACECMRGTHQVRSNLPINLLTVVKYFVQLEMANRCKQDHGLAPNVPSNAKEGTCSH